MENAKIRQYLLVDTAKTVSGIEVPRRVYWFDGRSWEVESVNLIMPVPKAKDGTTRFSITINKRKTDIFKDFRGWFVYPRAPISAGEMETMKKERLRKILDAEG